MARKKKPLPLLEQVEIADIAAEGKSITRVGELVVFVPYAVPGDIVDIQITRKKHSYAEGKVVKFHKYSDKRVEAFCSHYGVCGGCKWQILPYEEQLKAKQKQIFDNLTRIGKIALPEFMPIIGSEKTTEYRNKLEFGFSNKRWITEDEIKRGEKFDTQNSVGFHVQGSFDKILPIEKCYLMDDICNRIRNGVRDYALSQNLSLYDQREHKGFMRNMMIRSSNSGELMLVLQFCYDEEFAETEAHGVLNYIAENFSEVTSLMYVNNQKFNDTIGDLDIKTYKGTDHIYELMENLKFKVGPKSFYQTNNEQAYNLYKVAREFAGLTGKELVYDLYTGTGTIANFVASKAKRVIGVEYVPEAIEDAKVNSQVNNIENTLFFAGDMKDILNQEFVDTYGRPDVIITDPPRAGMHNDVIDTILFAEPKKIVYVSCNPATQARDLQLLDVKYAVTKVQPLDLFPHTHHVENVVLLELK